jgi:hypothetical protein
MIFGNSSHPDVQWERNSVKEVVMLLAAGMAVAHLEK